MIINEKMRSPLVTARLAGLAYLLQIPLAVFGVLFVPNNLVVVGNLSATIHNISANESLFRLSIFAAILSALDTVVTAIFLYQLLRVVQKSYAQFIVIFTLVALPIALINELNHAAVLFFLTNPGTLTAFPGLPMQTLVALFLDLHRYGLEVVGIFWGLWLLPMGYLVFKSSFLPKTIGVLLIVGFGAYMVDFVTFFVFPTFGVRLTHYTFFGEVAMVLWLLIRGVNVQKWEKLVQ